MASTNFYKQNGSYFTTTGQKILNPTELQGYAKAGGKEVSMPTIPTGATKIAGPSGLYGLNESQLYRQGADIYKLPSIPQEISTDKMTGGASIPQAEQTPSVEPLMAGVKTGNDGLQAQLEALQKQLTSQPKANALTAEQEKYRTDQATAQRTLQEQKFQQLGLNENVAQVQALMPQIARVQAEYDNANIAQEGRKGMAGSIYGRQALIQRQKAVELAGLSAVAQAYQGNVDLARNIAQDAVNAQYQDITTYNNNLQNQINSVYEDLTKEEKVKADQINLVIAERNRQIEEEKNNATAIQNLAIQSAQAGVDNTIVSNILKSGSISKAIEMAAQAGVYQTKIGDRYVEIGEDSNGNKLYADTVTNTVKTADQLTQNQLGNQVGTIKGLPSYDTRAANPGMVRSDRNNNPGNIKITDYTKDFTGVVGVESNPAEDGGNFIIFDNPQSGLDAIGRLLLEGKAYQGVNAETAIKAYNGNGAYGALDVGLDPNTDFQSQIQDPNKRREVARDMAMAEGWSGGMVNDTISNRAKLVLDNPALLSNYTNTEKGKIIDELANAGVDTTPLEITAIGNTAIKDISQSKDALDGLLDLSAKIKDNLQYIGPIKGLAALNPWSKARQVQSDIDRIRQTVGKALEGGVLRKEDEEKYKKILATITDTPETAQYKIKQLMKDIQSNVVNYGKGLGLSEQYVNSKLLNSSLYEQKLLEDNNIIKSSAGTTSSGISYTIE